MLQRLSSVCYGMSARRLLPLPTSTLQAFITWTLIDDDGRRVDVQHLASAYACCCMALCWEWAAGHLLTATRLLATTAGIALSICAYTGYFALRCCCLLRTRCTRGAPTGAAVTGGKRAHAARFAGATPRAT